MTDQLFVESRAYLAPTAWSFWSWAAADRVVTWWTGETIAFHPELELVLRGAAPVGLPPLSIVLLVLAACRDTWESALAQPANVTRLTSTFQEAKLSMGDMKRLLDGLMRVSHLPSDLRHPPEARINLLRFLFESGDGCVSADRAGRVCDALARAAPASLEWLFRPVSQARVELETATRELLNGLDRLDEDSLRLRQKTGMDQLLREAAIDKPSSERARDLIGRLQDDDEFHGLARLARDLMAAVHMPRAISEPEELPIGGFSDIANRGPVDRLLVSELAHDDLTLAVRVALNEALYLRREAPPKTPSPGRALLIDVGIRMWGLPRVFAAAVGMALTATAGHAAVTTAYRAKGDRIEHANLTSREGLIQHLAALEPYAHPGRALQPFLAQSSARGADCDRIIITSAVGAADPEFQQMLRDQNAPRVYLATVEPTGVFQFLRQGAHARQLLCEAQLNVEELLQLRHRPTAQLVDRDKQLSPAIFGEARFPLFVPANRVNYRQCWLDVERGVFEIATDRRLLLWDTPGRGPRQIAEHVPCKGSVCWASPRCRENTTLAVLGGAPGATPQLLRFDLLGGDLEMLPLYWGQDTFAAISGHDDMIFAMEGRTVRALSTVDGRCLDELGLDRLSGGSAMRHARGRFFREQSTGAWYALTYDGHRIGLECVVDAHTQKTFDVVSMIDWVDREGPVGITSDGMMLVPQDKQLREIVPVPNRPVSVREVAGSGEWIVVEYPAEGGAGIQRKCVSLSTGRSRVVWGGGFCARKAEVAPWIRQASGQIHRQFSSMIAHRAFGLSLVSRKGACWKIELDRQRRLKLLSTSHRVWDYRPHVRTFRQASLAGGGYRVFATRWDDGSEAFVDSRGLLHLRSSDARIPELTMVLADEEVSGWCADGRLWGHPYFVGEGANAAPEEIYAQVLAPFLDSLP